MEQSEVCWLIWLLNSSAEAQVFQCRHQGMEKAGASASKLIALILPAKHVADRPVQYI